MKVIFVGLLFVALAASSAVPVEVPKTDSAQPESEDLVQSILGRAIRSLGNVQKIASQPNIELAPGVVFESDNPSSLRNARQLMNTDVPFAADERLNKMFEMMYDIFNNFFSGRTLKVKMPKLTADDAARALEEGRKLKKKMMSPVMMAIIAKVALLAPLLLGALAFLAAKAAIIAKIALVLALFAGAGNIFGGGFGGKGDLFGKFGGNQAGWNQWSGYQGNSYSPAWNSVAQGGPYARSGESAQDLAYAAQKP